MKILLLLSLSIPLSCNVDNLIKDQNPESSQLEGGDESPETIVFASEQQVKVEKYDAELSESATENSTAAPEVMPPEVKATLSGFPVVSANRALVKVTVSNVFEYRWKTGFAAEDCQLMDRYSSLTPISTPIELDLSPLPDKQLVFLCVLGRNASGLEQKQSSSVSWIWDPSIPILADQVQLVDGFNLLTIRPLNLPGNWLIVKSRETLNALPLAARDYTPGDAIGNGSVFYSGTITTLTDNTVLNGDTFHFTFFAISEEKRYSAPVRKSLTLAPQIFQWVSKVNYLSSQIPVPIAANSSNQFVCRAVHTNASVQPGSLVPNNSDFKNGVCTYPYGDGGVPATQYEILVVNKGNPFNLLSWTSGSSSTGSNIIPVNAYQTGEEPVNSVATGLYSCRVYTSAARTQLLAIGKTGPHLIGAGCHTTDASTGVVSVTSFYDVLSIR